MMLLPAPGSPLLWKLSNEAKPPGWPCGNLTV